MTIESEEQAKDRNQRIASPLPGALLWVGVAISIALFALAVWLLARDG